MWLVIQSCGSRSVAFNQGRCVVVTQQEIDEAEAVAELAEAELDRATSFRERTGSSRAAVSVESAAQAAGAARAKARHLRGRLAAQEAAGQARAAAEGKFSDRQRKALVKELGARRDAAVAAVVAAEAASAELLERVAAYSEAVQGAAADLRGRGLDASDGQGPGGTVAGTVCLNGETWRPADAASVLVAVAAGAVRGRYPRHPFAVSHPERLGPLAARSARDALLAEASLKGLLSVSEGGGVR
jgi:hypothetical protein